MTGESKGRAADIEGAVSDGPLLALVIIMGGAMAAAGGLFLVAGVQHWDLWLASGSHLILPAL